MTSISEARPRGGSEGRAGCSLLEGRKKPEPTKTFPSPQTTAAEAARFLTRQQVFESAEWASDYLACLMNLIAADDTPGIRYAYAKFAAHGKVIALGCKELTASPEDGAG